MKILVIGSGGREHAIIMKLSESPRVEALFCAPGNGGISRFAECFDVKANDIDGVLALAERLDADMVIVAPEEPLALGMVDALNAAGIATFGPNKAAAIIEGSKVFSKELMKKYNIPAADYEVFADAAAACSYIKSKNSYPTVIKADGLALGKGVIIAENEAAALAAVHSMLEEKIFGESGSHIVVEEFLTGAEVSVLAFCDGKTLRPMISSMDHKRALDGDKGLNTGGMGAISPNPFFTKALANECMTKIFIPTVEAMRSENRPFKGCLYFGLMLTPSGPKVIEYNCRFGDPETQVVLPLLETDLAEIFTAVYAEELDRLDIRFKQGAAACVVMASGGYPSKYTTGINIRGLDEKGQTDGVFVYHSGTKYDGEFSTAGGRVLGITSTGSDIAVALNTAYKAVDKISFENAHYRHDIGQKALEFK